MEPIAFLDDATILSVVTSAELDSVQPASAKETAGQVTLQSATLEGDVPGAEGIPTLAAVCGDFAYLFVPGQPIALEILDGGEFVIVLPTAPGCHIGLSGSAEQQSQMHDFLKILARAGFYIFMPGAIEALPEDTDFAALASQHANQSTAPVAAEALSCTTSQLEDDAVVQQAPRWSRGIAAGLGAAAAATAYGVKAVAGVTAYGMNSLGGAINSRVTPRSKQPMQVSQDSKDRIAAVKSASDASLRVTGALLDKVEQATTALGSGIANRLTGPATSSKSTPPQPAEVSSAGHSPHGAMPESVQVDTPPQSTSGGGSFLPPGLVNGLFLVGRAGFAAANTVWEEVEGGAAEFGGAVKQHSVLFAQKRYGDEVATATGDALKAAGGFVWSAYRLNGLGLKSAVSGVAKSTAKHSAHSLLK